MRESKSLALPFGYGSISLCATRRRDNAHPPDSSSSSKKGLPADKYLPQLLYDLPLWAACFLSTITLTLLPNSFYHVSAPQRIYIALPAAPKHEWVDLIVPSPHFS